MSTAKKQPWWETLQAHGGGDVIVGVVGRDAHGVAVGKNIQQWVDSGLGPVTPSDKETIQQQLSEVTTALNQLLPRLDPARAAVAPIQLETLKEEISKTGDAEVPSGSAIVRAGDWLLDNLPDIAEAVTSLFATPAVGKVVGKAGDVVVSWARRRFGASGAAPSATASSG
jgi:hypothetical protein